MCYNRYIFIYIDTMESSWLKQVRLNSENYSPVVINAWGWLIEGSTRYPANTVATSAFYVVKEKELGYVEFVGTEPILQNPELITRASTVADQAHLRAGLGISKIPDNYTIGLLNQINVVGLCISKYPLEQIKVILGMGNQYNSRTQLDYLDQIKKLTGDIAIENLRRFFLV